LTCTREPPQNEFTLSVKRNPRLVQGAMAAGAVVAAGLILLAVAAIFGFDVRTVPSRVLSLMRRPAPVYRWAQSDDRTFSFLPGEGKAWGPVDPQQGEVRYDIRSYLPVDTGLMAVDAWGERADAWDVMKAASTCYQGKIVQAAKSCPIQSGKPQLIFIRDIRVKQFGLDGITAEFAGGKGLKDQNSVVVTIYAWKCVENCKSEDVHR
jgi:hypothetical protein